MGTINNENVVQKFVENVPELEEIYKNEIDKWGEVSNYMFFGPYLRKFINARVNTLSETDQEVLNKVFDFIEQCALSPEKKVVDLILAGFFQQLNPEDPNYETIKGFMRPKTLFLLSEFFPNF